jgi:polysaccharide pyruvyl transferase WcaK-like protein
MNIVICRVRFADNNIGERFILSSVLKRLNATPYCHITVLSDTPKLTARVHVAKVADCSFQRYHRAFRAILNSDLILWCGGNMLQEQFSYLHIPFVAKDFLQGKILGKKIFIYGVEIGPIVSTMGKFFTKRVLQSATMIVVRNLQSYQLAKKLGAKDSRLFLSEDPVFSISTDGLLDRSQVLERFSFKRQKPLVGICPRILFERRRSYLPFHFRMRHGLLSDEFYRTRQKVKDLIIKISRFLVDTRIQVVFLPMDINDEIFCDEIAGEAGKDCVKIALSSLELKEVMSLFSIMDLVISMRLHGLILASCLAVPVIGISGVDKVNNF